VTAGASSGSPKPGLWTRMSVSKGNLVQLAGLVLGALLMVIAANFRAAEVVRVVLMLVGFLIIYDCCHAISHWAIGRLVGIRFRGYGVRGTDHPEAYPPGIRQLMSTMPFFTAMTQKESISTASPTAKALMFAAGETGTTVISLLAALYAWQSGIPGGGILFWVMVVWNVVATVATTVTPKGDYAKAIRALRVD
jgi:hypothetical protein